MPERLLLFVEVQLIVTIFLAILLSFLYFRLRQSTLFRWWAWAWIFFAVYLVAASISLRLGPAWTLAKAACVFCLLFAGFLEVNFFLLGAWCFRFSWRPSRKWIAISWLSALALAAFSLALGYYWRSDLAASMAIRNAPRTFLLASVLFYSAYVLYLEARSQRSLGAALTACFCFLYGLDQAIYTVDFVRMFATGYGFAFPYTLRSAAALDSWFRSGLLYLDIISTCGIAFGLVLLLLEEHSVARHDLAESERLASQLSVINARLQLEVQERLRAESALRESELRYRDLVESCDDLHCTHDVEGRLLSINPAPARRLGYTVEELLGMSFADLLPARFRSEFPAFIQRTLQNGQDKGVMAICSRNGEERIWQYTSTLRSREESPLVIRGTAHDITEQHRALKALRSSEAKFASTFNASPLAISITSIRTGRLLDVNETLMRQFGFTREELIGRTPVEVGMWADPRSLHAILQDTLDRGVVHDREVMFKTKSGQTYLGRYSVVVIDYDGEPCALAAGNDVTPLRTAERERREHALFIDALISNSPIGIVVKDDQHRVMFCNSSFERMFQFTQAELVGRNPDELICGNNPDEASHFNEISRRQGIVHANTQRCRKDGTLIDVELYGVELVTDGNFVGAFALYQDITDRRRAEQKLQTLRDRLTRAQEDERARIARDLHDDTGQRLSLIGIQLDQLITSAPADIAPHLKSLQQIAQELTTDIHKLSRRLHPSQVEVLGLPRALEYFCRDLSAQGSPKVSFFGEPLSVTPPHDSALCLYRVAQEALQNALKHSHSSEVFVELSETDGQLQLFISDNGIGFDQAALAPLGGIGLLSMEERVRSLNGSLTIESAPGRGTSIHAAVPIPRSVLASS